MRLLLSTAILTLAWFAAISAVASALAWVAARWLGRRRDSTRPDVLLLLRLLPAGVSTLFAVALFIPAHVRFEPAQSDETFGALVGVLTLLGLTTCGRSIVRALRVALISTRTRQSSLTPVASGVEGAYEVADFHGVSLAGIFRPRILVGAQALRALTPDELDVAIAHEHAHRASCDNLKRWAMFCAPDLFGWSRAAHDLELRWRAQAECQADSCAVAGDETRAIHLASALVKVARLGPGVRGPLASPVWSTFHEPVLLEARVRRLVSGMADTTPSRPIMTALVLATLAAAAVLVSYSGGAQEIHHVTEALVHLLP